MAANAETHPKLKRRRLDWETPELAIASAKDLHRLLDSSQTGLHQVRGRLQRFKDFLLAILQSEAVEIAGQSLQILKVYSEAQLSINPQAPTFPDLISIWSAAVESNHDSILSSVPSLLALLLKIVSSHLEFRNIGLSLCKSLLQKDQLRLLDRGLTATKTKDHLISPCLRLLTEIVSFDGGELAGLVYSKRDTTFKRLEVFLEQRAPSGDGPKDHSDKPTLRRIAQRYLLANLKFQSAKAKRDIIAQGKILKSCLQNLKNDQADIIQDILGSLEKEILRATTLTKSVKCRPFNISILASLASLYTICEPAGEESSGSNLRDKVDLVLRLICTQQDSGLLRSQNGWYPAGKVSRENFQSIQDPNKIDIGLGPTFHSGDADKSAVKNVVLSIFIRALRPETDRLQTSLLLDIFRAAPELVADYFSNKSNFIIEPKDTPAWLGQSAFLFSTIQLPVPRFCGWKDDYAPWPPPSSVVIESVLPRPLDRPATTRALNLNHEVITLFAVRALTVAFQKLSRVLDVYRIASSKSEAWRHASTVLLRLFSQRCPPVKDVVSTLQRTPSSDPQLRSFIIELIANYYRFLPHLMFLEKFDASSALTPVIGNLDHDAEDSSMRSSRFSELENLLQIAHASPDSKWWQRPGKCIATRGRWARSC